MDRFISCGRSGRAESSLCAAFAVPREAGADPFHFGLEPQVGLKSMVLHLLQRANYAVIHADVLEQERHAATIHLERLQALGEIDAADARAAAAANKDERERPKLDEKGQPEAAAEAPAAAAEKLDIRPLAKISRDEDFAFAIDREWIRRLLTSDRFRATQTEFQTYPRLSFVHNIERAFLFCLVRAMKPRAVAEIGTAFCGTSEIIARALWENGTGVLHTTDPFGAERCPPIFQQWPQPLQDTVRFYVKSSMDFFLELADKNTTLDIAFVDGNHDLEFAYFDIMLAARLLRPGGIMIIDNSEQSGPYYAAVQFIQHNPDWIELGEAISGFDTSQPFLTERSSVPSGGFLILRAPDHYCVGNVPRSTGQVPVLGSPIDGVTSTIESEEFRGTMHYQIIFRAFRSGNREIEEYKRMGCMRLDAATTGRTLALRLDEPLVSHLNERHGDCRHTLEIELAWEAAAGEQSTIRLSAAPLPLTRVVERPDPEAVDGGKA
jgi:predicted O-methyltransferase YrrM